MVGQLFRYVTINMMSSYKMTSCLADVLYYAVHSFMAPRSNERYCGNNVILLQLAVEHGMGGAESAAKATWMVDAIDQWFQENG